MGKYISVDALVEYCKNQKDHSITPNDFMRMGHYEIPYDVVKKFYQPGTTSVTDYLLNSTYVHEIVVFRIGGYIEGATYIDDEDEFTWGLSDRLDDFVIESESWGKLKIHKGPEFDRDIDSMYTEIPVHYLDLKEKE